MAKWYPSMAHVYDNDFRRAIYSQEWLLRDKYSKIGMISTHPDLTIEDYVAVIKSY
jgi:hypothetical protein